MNFDDSLLTAYLDGELPPDRRLMVESVLLSSPVLAARLGELNRLRDALDGLPRPNAPIDFAPLVLGRIWQAEARRRQNQAQFRRFLVLGPVTAAAAVLLFTFFQGGWQRDEAARPGATVARGPAVDSANTSPSTPSVARIDAPLASEFVGPPVPERLSMAATPPAPPEGQLEELLGQPDVRRILVRVDELDDSTLERIGEAVVATPRSDPRRARFHVPGELNLDPDLPGEAAVFVVVLDEAELTRFREQLADRFPTAGRCESPVSDRLLATLNSSSSLQVLREQDQPAATLVTSRPPSVELSARRVAEPPVNGPNMPQPLPDTTPVPVVDPPAQADSETSASVARVYLIWVARRG